MADKRNVDGTPQTAGSYGFVCQQCKSPLLLSDPEVRSELMQCFQLGAASSEIRCAKCGTIHTYVCADLQVIVSSESHPPAAQEKAAGSSE
jgi:RNase P subunit RPR2